MIYQGKSFYGSNMRNMIFDVLTNRTKVSFQMFPLEDLDALKDLVKNMKHLQMIEVYKNEKTNNDPFWDIEEEKMVVLSLSTLLVLFYYIALIFFFFLICLRLQQCRTY